jgi:(p)ppGpp synthase/HD superfamily hydrolase
VGLGNRTPQLIAHLVSDILASTSKRKSTDKSLLSTHEKNQSIAATTRPLAIKGTEGLVITYATCCRPIPGDAIVGIVQPGQGLVVHVDNCKTLAKLTYSPDQIIPVQWSDHIEADFKADVSIETLNQRGVLGQLASTIAASEADIDNISVNENDEQSCTVNLTIIVHNRVHLARVMRRLRRLKAVEKIVRPR